MGERKGVCRGDPTSPGKCVKSEFPGWGMENVCGYVLVYFESLEVSGATDVKNG